MRAAGRDGTGRDGTGKFRRGPARDDVADVEVCRRSARTKCISLTGRTWPGSRGGRVGGVGARIADSSIIALARRVIIDRLFWK
jgi:hypothetical protein